MRRFRLFVAAPAYGGAPGEPEMTPEELAADVDVVIKGGLAFKLPASPDGRSLPRMQNDERTSHYR